MKRDFRIFAGTTWCLFKKDLKASHAGSLMGGVWVVLYPLVLTLVVSIIFSFVFKDKIMNVPYFLYAMIGFVVWVFFSRSLSSATRSLIDNRALVLSSTVSRESIVISTILTKLLDFLISSLFFIIILAYYSNQLTGVSILGFGLISLVQLCFQVGLGLVFASLNIFLRDLEKMIEVLLRLLFYATPVLYPVEVLPEKIGKIIRLNPLTQIIWLYRNLFFSQKLNLGELSRMAVLAGMTLVIGVGLFNQLKVKFADKI